jgi:SAM-dependent methyltransferase
MVGISATATRKRRYLDRYADGIHITARRKQKAEILSSTLGELLPGTDALELVDFGCADGAVPVLMLHSPLGQRIRRITGITLLDYNDLPDKPSHLHHRFLRTIGDLEGSLDHLTLPWGACDAVTATAFFHYCEQPDIPFAHAAKLLKPGGYLLAGMPAPWVLSLRSRGVPGVLPRNGRIRTIVPLDLYRRLAAVFGLVEVRREPVQWLAAEWSAGVERTLRTLRFPFAAHHLVVYQKQGGPVETPDFHALLDDLAGH